MKENISEPMLSEDKLNTEEILSIIKKNEKIFSKDTKISGKVSKLFKRQPLKEIAKDNNIPDSKETDPQEAEKKNLTDSTEEEIRLDLTEDSQKAVKEEVIIKNQKKYTEEEANTKAKDLAKKYYYYGYNLGVKNIKKELLKGENKISLALKNILDNLFLVSEKFTSQLNESLNRKTLEICKEILGYEISNQPEKFLKKITDLAERISNSVKKTQVVLNKDDYNLITTHINNLKKKLSIEILPDNNLERGDMKIISGDIQLEELVKEDA